MTRYESPDDGITVLLDCVEPAATQTKRGPLPRCPDCGHVATTRPHAPRMVGTVKRDCQGRPV